jgi:hypothetical protein
VLILDDTSRSSSRRPFHLMSNRPPPEASHQHNEETTGELNQLEWIDDDVIVTATLRRHRRMIQELLQKHRVSIQGRHYCTDIIPYPQYKNNNYSHYFSGWPINLTHTANTISLAPYALSAATTSDRQGSESWRRESSIRLLNRFEDEDFSLFNHLDGLNKESSGTREERGECPIVLEEYFDAWEGSDEKNTSDEFFDFILDKSADSLLDEKLDCASRESIIVEEKAEETAAIEGLSASANSIARVEIETTMADQAIETGVLPDGNKDYQTISSLFLDRKLSPVISMSKLHNYESFRGHSNIESATEENECNVQCFTTTTSNEGYCQYPSPDEAQKEIDHILDNFFDIMDSPELEVDDVGMEKVSGVEKEQNKDVVGIISCEEEQHIVQEGLHSPPVSSKDLVSSPVSQVVENRLACVVEDLFSMTSSLDDCDAVDLGTEAVSITKIIEPTGLYLSAIDTSLQHFPAKGDKSEQNKDFSSLGDNDSLPTTSEFKPTPQCAMDQLVVNDILDNLFVEMTSMDILEEQVPQPTIRAQVSELDNSGSRAISLRQENQHVKSHLSPSDSLFQLPPPKEYELEQKKDDSSAEDDNSSVAASKFASTTPTAKDHQQAVDDTLTNIFGTINSMDASKVKTPDTPLRGQYDQTSPRPSFDMFTRSFPPPANDFGVLFDVRHDVGFSIQSVEDATQDLGAHSSSGPSSNSNFNGESPQRLPVDELSTLSPIFPTQAMPSSPGGIGGDKSVFTASIQSLLASIEDKQQEDRTADQIESSFHRESTPRIIGSLQATPENCIAVEPDRAIAPFSIQFTPLQESRSRITSPDLILSLNVFDMTLDCTEVCPNADKSCSSKARRPHDPVAVTLSRNSSGPADVQMHTLSTSGSTLKAAVLVGPPFDGDLAPRCVQNGSSDYLDTGDNKGTTAHDTASSGEGLGTPPVDYSTTPKGESSTTDMAEKDLDQNTYTIPSDPYQDIPSTPDPAPDDASIPSVQDHSVSSMSESSLAHSDDSFSSDSSGLVPTQLDSTEGRDQPATPPRYNGAHSKNLALQSTPLRNRSSTKKNDPPTVKTSTPIRFDPNIPFSRTSERLDRRQQRSAPSTPHMVETSRSPFLGESSGTSVGIFSSPDRSSIRSLRGFHAVSSPHRAPVSSRLLPRTPREIEIARASQGATKESQCYPEAASHVSPCSSHHLRVCTKKFMYNLHPIMGPCDRCFSLASLEEQEKYMARGTHLRIARTRGGCDRTCAIFPAPEDAPPVRLCRQCFFATHQHDGSRIQVYKGNHVKLKLAL